jgi:hypothetical protein
MHVHVLRLNQNPVLSVQIACRQVDMHLGQAPLGLQTVTMHAAGGGSGGSIAGTVMRSGGSQAAFLQLWMQVYLSNDLVSALCTEGCHGCGRSSAGTVCLVQFVV